MLLPLIAFSQSNTNLTTEVPISQIRELDKIITQNDWLKSKLKTSEKENKDSRIAINALVIERDSAFTVINNLVDLNDFYKQELGIERDRNMWSQSFINIQQAQIEQSNEDLENCKKNIIKTGNRKELGGFLKGTIVGAGTILLIKLFVL